MSSAGPQNPQQMVNQLLHEQSVILDNTIVGIVKIQHRSIIWANRAFENLVGYAPGECLGTPISVYYASQADYDSFGALAYEAIRAGKVFRASGKMRRKDGRTIWVDMSAAAIDLASGVSLGAMLDITETVEAEAALREREQRLKRVLEGSDQGFWDWNLLTNDFSVSPRFEHMLGYEPGEMDVSGPHWAQHVHAVDLLRADASIQRHLAGETPAHEQELRCRTKSGGWRWILTRGRVVERDAQGRPTFMSGTHSDITERKQAEEALRIAAIAFESQEGMFVTDAARVILRVNGAFTQITGYSAEDAVGKTPRLLSSGRHDAAFYAAMQQHVRSTGAWQGEIWNRRKNGDVYPEWLTVTAVKDSSGAVQNFVATLTDISGRKASEDQIRKLAFFDPLTGLPNRRLLLDRLEHALAFRTRKGCDGALLLVDLDNFKHLNDNRGHPVGDQLLQQAGQRVLECIREEDTLARFGGDEFMVILENLSDDAQQAAQYAESVAARVLSALAHPYLLEGQTHHHTASIGITLFSDYRDTIEALLKQAEMAMYEAKRAGRNTLQFFDPVMLATVAARAALEAGLREAVLQGQFELYYQAQVQGCDQLKGAEALLRWQHPQRGMVSPAEFIPLAEETGLILPMGLWVLQAACSQLAVWAEQTHMAHLTLAVNVSARQFRQDDFVDSVLTTLAQTGANPQRLKLELTESLLVVDVEAIILKMVALKKSGVGFSLDDFGTGYSSLSYLKRLPLDQLKIDQSFVRDCQSNGNDAAIAKMVIALANSLGLQVIAEGVETEAQRQFLQSEGCQNFQGYLFSRPLPLPAFEALALAATGSA